MSSTRPSSAPVPAAGEPDRPVAPPVGRRERRRRETMHRIQVAALDLFDAEGYDRVTIEQVAESADVSPSTVYRHFGTKEGLLLQDEYDDAIVAATVRHLRDHDLVDAVRRSVAEIQFDHFEQDLELSFRRIRYAFEVPSVRAAIGLLVADMATALADAMAEAGSPLPALERHVQARAVVGGILAGIEQWWEAGAAEPVDVMLERCLLALRFADPEPPAERR